MSTRDKWRVCTRVCVFLFLAAVTRIVLQSGIIGTGATFQIERPVRTEASDGGEGVLPQKTGLSFWETDKLPRPEAQAQTDTEEPGNTHEQGPTTWDVITTNCSANLNLSDQDWFRGLEDKFKQFLLYRHCRLFPMLINHPEKCAGGEIFLLVVIKSIATQHDRREVIRQTWGKEQALNGKHVRTLFLLGTSSNDAERANHQKLVEYEDYIFRDILQWDFLDSFFNLTLKETHFLKWFNTYCPNVHYIFKGDDDVFVSIENIYEFLEGSSHVRNLFVGDAIFDARPIRIEDNKYYIPRALYNKTLYPPYCGGGGFLMDGPLARRLYWASDRLELFPIDDVFLGMCLEVLQVSPIHHDAFKTFGLVENNSSSPLNTEPCFFKSMILVHKLLPPDLRAMWDLLNGELVCSQKDYK